jgi:hypothetical protein
VNCGRCGHAVSLHGRRGHGHCRHGRMSALEAVVLATRASVMAGHTREKTKAIIDDIMNAEVVPCECPRATKPQQSIATEGKT